MKKKFIAILVAFLLTLGACGTKSSNDSPYLNVLKAYREYKGDEERQPQDSEIEMQIDFINIWSWLDYYGGKIYYAFYKIDSNDSQALLISGKRSDNRHILLDVYVIQDGIAVQQQGIFCGEGYSSWLLKNGTILSFEGEMGIYNYYRFEGGQLKLQASLFDSYFEDKYVHRQANGKEVEISKEEFDRLRKEYEGGMENADIQWKRL